MDAYVHPRSNTTYAEIAEDRRFAQVLSSLDPSTATLLRVEKIHWSMAEMARQRELDAQAEFHRGQCELRESFAKMSSALDALDRC